MTMSERGDDGLTDLHRKRLEQRAARERWGLSDEVRMRIAKRVLRYVDESTDDGAEAAPRTVLIAAKTLMAADRISLEQQKLEALQKLTREGESVTPETIEEAFAIVASRRAVAKKKSTPARKRRGKAKRTKPAKPAG